ncbi:unnamed protein product [Calicophoron daubneyi]|uniref:Uncharacterized protein n=1 Tax=Calicophoron daubneyi TaxID=300641 RepID=A0AAV2TVM9_CALDB
MNPYSFKRFLQNPERPRHPVQLVRSDANCIIVHGDLPDCVQNQSVPTVDRPIPISSSASDLPDTLTGYSGHLPGASNLPILSSSNDPSLRELSYSLLTNSPPRFQNSHQTSTHLPDVHPCNEPVANHRSESILDPIHINSTLDILPRALPDFIAGGSTGLGLSPVPDFDDHTHSAAASRECAHSKTSRSNTSLPNLTQLESIDASTAVYNAPERLSPARQFTQIRPRSLGHISTSSAPAVIAAFPFPGSSSAVSDRHPPVYRCTGSGDRAPTARQGDIASLLVRQSQLEAEVASLQQSLNEGQLSLRNVQAEAEVAQRQAELRIKELEHELAKEKLVSAQNRRLVVRLTNQLTALTGQAVDLCTLFPQDRNLSPRGCLNNFNSALTPFSYAAARSSSESISTAPTNHTVPLNRSSTDQGDSSESTTGDQKNHCSLNRHC